MKYSAEITVKDEAPEKLFAAFQNEKNTDDRSSFEIKKKEKEAVFIIKANDAVALRATMNSIIKLIQVYEKIK